MSKLLDQKDAVIDQQAELINQLLARARLKEEEIEERLFNRVLDRIVALYPTQPTPRVVPAIQPYDRQRTQQWAGITGTTGSEPIPIGRGSDLVTP